MIIVRKSRFLIVLTSKIIFRGFTCLINFSMKLFAVSDSLCIFAMDAEEMRRSDIELHITRRILLQACSSSLHNG